MRFEWDGGKAESNARKHGVTFETATRVFLDPFGVTEQDRIEDGEYRWQTLGMADGMLILMVAHTDRNEGDLEVIRIISAREATPKEKRRYGQNRYV